MGPHLVVVNTLAELRGAWPGHHCVNGDMTHPLAENFDSSHLAEFCPCLCKDIYIYTIYIYILLDYIYIYIYYIHILGNAEVTLRMWRFETFLLREQGPSWYLGRASSAKHPLSQLFSLELESIHFLLRHKHNKEADIERIWKASLASLKTSPWRGKYGCVVPWLCDAWPTLTSSTLGVSKVRGLLQASSRPRFGKYYGCGRASATSNTSQVVMRFHSSQKDSSPLLPKIDWHMLKWILLIGSHYFWMVKTCKKNHAVLP